MFTKYVKSNNDTKVLLMYLLLNNYEMKKVKQIEEIEEDRMFGLKIKKIYGITEEFVDVRKIEQEINEIQTPIVCSMLSYEYYANSAVIHTYTAPNKMPLVINDMGVISKIMVISEQCIVSSNSAKSFTDSKNNGFMFFYDYVMKSEVSIGKWRMTYKDKVFNIYYQSESNGVLNTDLLYSAIEIDKTSTYKIVIYIINKLSKSIDVEWLPDNFKKETYELVVRNE